MIFKSRQVNLDPAPYVWPSGVRSMFTEGLGSDGLHHVLTYRPRSEFEPTRDPAPWWNPAEVIQTGNYARSSEQLPGYNYAPRREQFDTPVNRLLLEFRRLWAGEVDIVEQAAEMAHNLGEHDYLWELQEDTDYTPDEVEHARRVLTRLARL